MVLFGYLINLGSSKTIMNFTVNQSNRTDKDNKLFYSLIGCCILLVELTLKFSICRKFYVYVLPHNVEKPKKRKKKKNLSGDLFLKAQKCTFHPKFFTKNIGIAKNFEDN